MKKKEEEMTIQGIFSPLVQVYTVLIEDKIEEKRSNLFDLLFDLLLFRCLTSLIINSAFNKG